MKRFKRMIALMTLIMMIGTSGKELHGAEYVSTTGGDGYSVCRSIPLWIPALAFAAVAITLIVVFAVQNGGHKHHHNHCD